MIPAGCAASSPGTAGESFWSIWREVGIQAHAVRTAGDSGGDVTVKFMAVHRVSMVDLHEERIAANTSACSGKVDDRYLKKAIAKRAGQLFGGAGQVA
jgi:hypothetical protein